VISGHSEAEDLEQAKRFGVVAYVVKPFSPATLVDLIDGLEANFNQMRVIVP
jgi:AmiR/NasT family two-component response regulator